MEDQALRGRAIEQIERERRSSVLFAGYVVVSLLLIAIWGAAGAGYFWPIWPIAAGIFAFAFAALARGWSSLHSAETTIRQRIGQVGGEAPPGIQR